MPLDVKVAIVGDGGALRPALPPRPGLPRALPGEGRLRDRLPAHTRERPRASPPWCARSASVGGLRPFTAAAVARLVEHRSRARRGPATALREHGPLRGHHPPGRILGGRGQLDRSSTRSTSTARSRSPSTAPRWSATASSSSSTTARSSSNQPARGRSDQRALGLRPRRHLLRPSVAHHLRGRAPAAARSSTSSARRTWPADPQQGLPDPARLPRGALRPARGSGALTPA